MVCFKILYYEDIHIILFGVGLLYNDLNFFVGFWMSGEESGIIGL